MTDEQIAKAWASWATGHIIEDLDDRGLIDGHEDEIHDVILEHLTDIAISNSHRPPAMATPDGSAAK